MRLTAHILRLAAGIALVASIAIVATGCFKKVTNATTVVVKSLVEQTSGGDRTPSEGVVAYAYYIDGAELSIASYDDALAKRVTTAEGEERTAPDVEGEPYEKYETGCYTALPLKKTALIVVVEPQTKMYACMVKRLTAENLPQTFLTLIFHSWKDKEYTEGSKEGFKWSVFPPAKSEESGSEGGNSGEGGGESGGSTGDSGEGTEGGNADASNQ